MAINQLLPFDGAKGKISRLRLRLLFTIPILQAEKFRRDFQTFDIIGHLAQPDAGTVLVTPEGVEFPVKAQGWKDDSEA